MPPPSDSGQVLPERFLAQPPDGQALALKIDPTTMRMYPLDRTQMFALATPSDWVEAVHCGQGRTDVRLIPAGGYRAMALLVTAAAATPDFAPRAVADRTARALAGAGSARGEPIQPITVRSGEAYWFWSSNTGPNAIEPQDYPFVAHLVGRYDGVTLEARMPFSQDGPRRPANLAAVRRNDLDPPPAAPGASPVDLVIDPAAPRMYLHAAASSCVRVRLHVYGGSGVRTGDAGRRRRRR